MRICVVTKIWSSGTAWYAARLVEGLLEAVDRVGFIAPALSPASLEPHSPRLERIVTPRERYEGTPWSIRLSKAARIAANSLRALGATGRFDAYVFTIPDPVVSPLLFSLLRLLGRQVILVVHDPLPHDWHTSSARKGPRKLALRLLYASASRLVTLTEAGRQALRREFAIPAHRIAVIPHGAFELPGVGPAPGAGRMLVFGTIRANKNIRAVMEGVVLARREWPELRLLVAGNPAGGNEAYWESCLAVARRDPEAFELEARYIADDDIPAIVSRCDAFVLAYSEFDSQSGVAVMAGLSGRPVVATLSGGIVELGRDGLAVVPVHEPTPESIRDALLEYRRSDPRALAQAAEEGRARLRHTLSWARIGADFAALAAGRNPADPS